MSCLTYFYLTRFPTAKSEFQCRFENCSRYSHTSYNWEHSKSESVYELSGIDIKSLDDGGFQFYQTILIRKFLEATEMEHCNGLPTPTKVEAHLGSDTNGSQAN